MFQAPQLSVYDVEKKTEKRVNLDWPVGYTIDYVNF
jgi:hypothetical protein